MKNKYYYFNSVKFIFSVFPSSTFFNAQLDFSGPRLFLPCPMDVDGSRVWFTDLWNYSLVPYLLEAVREGLQVFNLFPSNLFFEFIS